MTIDEWVDPYPKPVIENVDGVLVVRDDLIEAGTKARALDYLIGHAPEYAHVKEWVYGSSPAHGYAQVSLASVCARYGKKAVIFAAARKNRHELQERAIALAAEFQWVNPGYLTVTQKRARDYTVADLSTRMLLPMGGDHPYAHRSLVKVAQGIGVTPDIVCSVGSSGTLSRALQEAWPDADVHVFAVGHDMTREEAGRAIITRSPYKFNEKVSKTDAPPFQSVPEYDAKGWSILQEYRRTGFFGNTKPNPTILFWNVGK